MKEEKRILNILGQVNEKYIEESAPYQKTNHKSKKLLHFWKAHTVAACICLIAMLFIMSFSTALAVNADFRQLVFKFFHVATPETVLPVEDEPRHSGDIEGIYNSDIDGAPSVEYVRIDGDFDFGNGIIYRYNDETRSSVSFYAVEDDKAILLNANREETEYIWKDTTYHICFDWCIYADNIGTYAIYKEPANDTYWTAAPISGRTDIVLLTLSSGRQDEYGEHVFFFDLKTKAVIDPFAYCEIDKLGILNTEFSPDMDRALLATDNGETVWYCDMNKKTLMTVDDFLGKAVDGSWFVDSDTICYYIVDANNQYTYYAMSLSTEKEHTVLQNIPMFGSHDSTWGVKPSGERFGVFVAEDQSVYAIDFKTGTRTPIAGYTYPADKNTHTISNRTGDKIAFVTYENGASGLSISQIGIMDLRAQTFTLLDRKGYDARHEASVSWFDDNRIVIWAVTDTYGYLYLYDFTK